MMGLGGSFLGKNKAAPTAQRPAVAAGQQQPLKPGQQQPLKPGQQQPLKQGQQQPLKPGQAGPQVSEKNKIETTYIHRFKSSQSHGKENFTNAFPNTGPKMFCAGPNFLSQPKNLFTYVPVTNFLARTA